MPTKSFESTAQATDAEWLTSTARKAELPDLTAEERKRPYAKYFHEDIPEPDPELWARMAAPCDPANAIGPERMNDLLGPGPLDVEVGWCILPNGTGFAANRIVYPDVTPEMVNWWFAWHALEDLRYRIWYPPQHAGIAVSPEDRRRLLDEAIPLAERNWGVVHHVTEDCDSGMANIDIHFMSPQAFGFDMDRWKACGAATFVGGQGWSAPVARVEPSMPTPALMCHVFRETSEGLEHRTRFWMGYRLSKGRPECCLPPGVAVPPPVVSGLAHHVVKEFTRFRHFLPRIFREFGGRMEG